MEIQAPPLADAAQLALMQQKLRLESRMRGGIGWFFWIAGLSLVNSGAYLFGAKFTFVVGLGITQLLDVIVSLLVKDLGPGWDLLRVVGTVIDILIAGAFVLIGYLGRKRMRWPVIVGMVLYAFDAILMVVFQDVLGAIFHVWALIGIWSGLRAMQALKKSEAPRAPVAIESLP